MSILYLLLFKILIEFTKIGRFSWGRFIDLVQLDLIALLLFMIMRYCRRVALIELWRWKRLSERDKEYSK